MSRPLGVAVLVALLARRLGRDPATAVAFVALNPLVLVYGIAGVHNDVFMLALLLGGALLALDGREILGGGAWRPPRRSSSPPASRCRSSCWARAGACGRRPGWPGGIAVLALVQVAYGGHLPNDGAQSRLVAS